MTGDSAIVHMRCDIPTILLATLSMSHGGIPLERSCRVPFTMPIFRLDVSGKEIQRSLAAWGSRGEILQPAVDGQNPFRATLKAWLKPYLVGGL